MAVWPSAGITTTILSVAGPVTVTAQNSGPAPVTLAAGEWVGVSARAARPVQSSFTEQVYRPAPST